MRWHITNFSCALFTTDSFIDNAVAAAITSMKTTTTLQEGENFQFFKFFSIINANFFIFV
jgi:hypothetical protein